jgi:hypothetical protein
MKTNSGHGAEVARPQRGQDRRIEDIQHNADAGEDEGEARKREGDRVTHQHHQDGADEHQDREDFADENG